MLKLPVDLPPIPSELKPLFDSLVSALEQAQHEISELKTALKGGRHAAPFYDPNQQYLPFTENSARAPQPPESEVKDTAPGKRKGHARQPWPDHLPRQREELHPPADQLRCKICDAKLKKIGEEITAELECRPATYWIHELVRVKYACAHCQENVVIADLPPRPILKGRPAASMLSKLVVAKYGDHQPLTRQQKQMAREGVRVAVSTLCDWVGQVEEMYKAIYGAMKKEALASGLLNADDTPVPVLDPPQRQTKAGRLWVHIGGGHIVFDYAPDKSAHWLTQFLQGFKGIFQGDSSSVNVSFARGEIIHAGCWAHCFRRFREALETAPALAREGMEFIRGLYAVEDEIREHSPPLTAQERAEVRQQQARAVLEQLQAWLAVHSRTTLPKSPLGEAISYALSQWIPLTRYLQDGRIAIDNNVSERNLRPVALGRHNWIFAGSDEGGKRAAVIYSLIQSCKLYGLNPYVYFRDTIPLLATQPAIELTPKAWAERKADEARSVSIRQAAETNL